MLGDSVVCSEGVQKERHCYCGKYTDILQNQTHYRLSLGRHQRSIRLVCDGTPAVLHLRPPSFIETKVSSEVDTDTS